MSSRAEVEKAFGVIEKSRLRPNVVLDSEIVYSVWYNREESFGQVLDKIIERIDSATSWHTQIFYMDIASRVFLAYWSDVIDDTFRAHEASAQENEDYDGRWIKVSDKELRLTVEKFEGPVDVTRYRVQRRNLFEESELVFDLDEQGRLEESLNPLRITIRLRDYLVDDVKVEREVKYRHGRIDTIKVVRTQRDLEGNLPILVKTTEFRISPLI